MQNTRIIYGRPDGGVNIVTPCRCVNEADLTDEFILQRAWDKLPPDAINPQVVTRAEIPTDRTFRDAWEHGGKKVQVNMDKARGIHMDHIREVRDAKLKELDVETMKAVGKGDQELLAVTEARKNFLRNIPQILDLSKAKTPEELKAVWPPELA